VEKSLLKLITNPYEEIAYHEGAVLRGVNFKWKERSVLMVVKITKRLDGDKVAFIEADSVLGCWEQLAAALYTTKFQLTWRADRYA